VPASSGVSAAGGANSTTKESAASGAPTAMYGRRRPHRLRVRSVTQPITESVMASKAREIAFTSAIQPSGTSTTSE
jgi:hypothetical protein